MGYIGSKYSVRAKIAYDSGLKPISKWSKKELVDILNNYYEGKYDFSKIKKDILLQRFLENKEWHHTAKFYNRTDFYGLDENYITNFNDEKYKEMLALSSIKDEPSEEKPIKFVYVTYVEWTGSRRHPIRNDIYKYGYIKDNWFHGDECKKKTDGKWFKIIKEYESEEIMLLEKNVAEQKERLEKETKEAVDAEKARMKQEKELEKERKDLAFQLYNEVHPEVTRQKFSRNKTMIEESKILVLECCKNQRSKLEQLKSENKVSKKEYRRKTKYLNKMELI